MYFNSKVKKNILTTEWKGNLKLFLLESYISIRVHIIKNQLQMEEI